MYQKILILATIIFLSSCQNTNSPGPSSLVSTSEELNQAIQDAKAGDEIVMSDGVWKDIQIRFTGNGTEEKPITLSAETIGGVTIEGNSDLKLGGEHLIVKGLHFKNGSSPSSAVIEFQVDKDQIAFHCRVTECVVEGFNKSQRNKTDLWVQFKGQHNQLDHSYLAGKSNLGPTIRVDLDGIENGMNYHKISNNHFGPRPPKGGPSAETIQIGNSSTSMVPSYTQVSNNLFERCNGEVEIISSKSNFNEFRNNVFYMSEGSLVTRHGNYCTLDGNYFIGDESSENIGGIRLIGTGHWVTNNYFYQLKGKNFRSPLAVMNGIPKSPLNRYIQVTDVVVAYNTWMDCETPLHFGVGSNVDQIEVLPASEIRSARPIRTTVANNLIYNSKADEGPIVAHDLLDGINFQNNFINYKAASSEQQSTINFQSFKVKKLEPNILIPDSDLGEEELYKGFGFKSISTDLFGNKRSGTNSIGAVSNLDSNPPGILEKSKYGPSWFADEIQTTKGQKHLITSSNELINQIEAAKEGDILELSEGIYEISAPLAITKPLHFESKDSTNKATIIYSGPSQSPLFEMNPMGELTLNNINLVGKGKQYAFASLDRDMSSLYNLSVNRCEISDFDYILKAYKYSFAEYINFTHTTFERCNNGLELSEEIEDKGEYNAENILIDHCEFNGIDKNVIDYYRGGYDESTVGGNLVITNSKFVNCGSKETSGILLNTYGIINVKIAENQFLNNKVKWVAWLWGAKNNVHENNNISSSGQIRVEQNLKLKLLY